MPTFTLQQQKAQMLALSHGYPMMPDMTALCSYAHPENYDTTDLERDPNAVLFPFNPEMYGAASDLYGPGSLIAWLLLIASVALTWARWPIEIVENERHRCPRLTADFLSVTGYTLFAATDTVIHAMGMLDLDHRATVLRCLHFPTLLTNSIYDTDNTTPDHDTATGLPNFPSIPDDLIHYGQKIIALTGPLSVCYIFFTFGTAISIMWFIYGRRACGEKRTIDFEDFIWRPHNWVARLFAATMSYVAICLIVTHASFGDFGSSFGLFVLEFTWPICLVPLYWYAIFVVPVIILLLACASPGFNWLIAMAVGGWNLYPRAAETHLEQKYAVVGRCVLVGVFGFLFTALVKWGHLTLSSDLGKSITERGQLASLLVGLVVAIFTMYEVFVKEQESQRLRLLEDVLSQQLQPLADVERQA